MCLNQIRTEYVGIEYGCRMEYLPIFSFIVKYDQNLRLSSGSLLQRVLFAFSIDCRSAHSLTALVLILDWS